MSGGWAGSDRGARLPADWPWRREQTKKRAGGRCERVVDAKNGGRFRCPRPGTDCDHVIRGDNHNLENLEWLCGPHHGTKSSREGNAARADRRALRSRPKPPERHPGEIRRRS